MIEEANLLSSCGRGYKYIYNVIKDFFFFLQMKLTDEISFDGVSTGWGTVQEHRIIGMTNSC